MSSKTPRRIALAVAALAAAGGGVLAASGVAVAGTVSPESCSTFTGMQLVHPGYAAAAKTETVTLTGSISGCVDQLGTPQPGSGSVVATLTGTGSKTSTSLSGTVTIDWPSSAGLEPTTGSLTLNGSPKGTETVGGETTGGADVANAISSSIVTSTVTKHRKAIVTAQFIGTAPFAISHNGG